MAERRAAILVFAVLVGACRTNNAGDAASSARESRMNATHCIGRFTFSVPLNVMVTGRSQSIYRVDVKTTPIADGDAQQVWSNILRNAKSVSPPPGQIQSVLHTFELLPSVNAVWSFWSRDVPRSLELSAVKAFSDHVLTVSRRVAVSDTEIREIALGKPHERAETLVRNVVNAYRQGTTTGFCAEFGSVVSEPGVNEETLIALRDSTAEDVRIKVSTVTVDEPDHRTYSNLSEERQLAAAQHEQLSVLKEEPVTAAGLTGIEIRIAAGKPVNPQFLRFTWHFAGEPYKADRPAINIVGTALATERARLESLWSVVLQSFRVSKA